MPSHIIEIRQLEETLVKIRHHRGVVGADDSSIRDAMMFILDMTEATVEGVLAYLWAEEEALTTYHKEV